MKSKSLVKLLIVLLILGSGIYFGYMSLHRSSSFWGTPTTDLSLESVNGLRLYQSVDGEEFIKQYGTNLKKLDNALFDYYSLNNGLIIATNKNKQIIRIDGNTTSRGITSVVNTINDVISAYGNNYYKRITDQAIPAIGYIDRKRQVTIEFQYGEGRDKVSRIRYDITSME